MYSTSDFRNGLKIELEGTQYLIVEFQHVKPGKGGAFVRTRLRNLVTGQVLDKTFRSGEKVGKPDLEERDLQYLYSDGEFYHFMDTSTYEQVRMTPEQLGDARDFITEEIVVSALFYQGRPISVELPNFVEMEIVKTDPGVRGDTATGGTKPAELATGAVINVPLFVNEGDRIRIDTRTREYIERV